MKKSKIDLCTSLMRLQSLNNYLKHLNWDSNFFNCKVGSISLGDADAIDIALELAHRRQYKMVYVYSSECLRRKAVGQYTLEDVGGLVSYEKNISSSEESAASNDIVRYELDAITDEIKELVWLSGRESRFNTDPLMSSKDYKELYSLWIEKLLKNRPETEILVAKRGLSNIGLIGLSLGIDECKVELLAVCMEMQGQGYGTRLLNSAEQISRTRGIYKMTLKTQLTNHSARAFYKKCGYEEISHYFLYHAHAG